MKSSSQTDTQFKVTTDYSSNKEKKPMQTKVVIRRLPPSWTKEVFVEHISPIPENDYLVFTKADMSLGSDAFSRAYINFINVDDLYEFKERFDGYVFLDSKGGEYPAVVEFALYQKIPKPKSKKIDSKKGTLDEDPDYLKFISLLENPILDEVPSMEATIEELEAKERSNTSHVKVKTPLIEYIQRKREERRLTMQRQREERRRREAERLKIKEEKKRKEAEERLQSSKTISNQDKTSQKDSKSSPDKAKTSTDSDKLRFSRKNREKLSREKAASSSADSKTSRDRSGIKQTGRADSESSRKNESYGKERNSTRIRSSHTSDRQAPYRETRTDDSLAAGSSNTNVQTSDSGNRTTEASGPLVEEREVENSEICQNVDEGRSKTVVNSEDISSMSVNKETETIDCDPVSQSSEQNDMHSSQSSVDTAGNPDTQGKNDCDVESTESNRRRKKDRPERALYVPRRARQPAPSKSQAENEGV